MYDKYIMTHYTIKNMVIPEKNDIVMVSRNSINNIGIVNKVDKNNINILMLDKNKTMNIDPMKDEWMILKDTSLTDLRNTHSKNIEHNVKDIITEKYDIFHKKYIKN